MRLDVQGHVQGGTNQYRRHKMVGTVHGTDTYGSSDTGCWESGNQACVVAHCECVSVWHVSATSLIPGLRFTGRDVVKIRYGLLTVELPYRDERERASKGQRK